MNKRKAHEDWEVVEPRTTEYGSRKGEPVCQSRNQGGYWRGQPCGNAAKHRVGVEVCCGVHIAQALDRNPGAGVENLDWRSEPENVAARAEGAADRNERLGQGRARRAGQAAGRVEGVDR